MRNLIIHPQKQINKFLQEQSNYIFLRSVYLMRTCPNCTKPIEDDAVKMSVLRKKMTDYNDDNDEVKKINSANGKQIS